MTAQDIVDELRTLGKPSIKKVLINHGACEPFFGVSLEDLKKIQKRVKNDHVLALELYDTGISDAMSLAGLIVDDARMTRKDLNRWVEAAYWFLLSESTVSWVAVAETIHYQPNRVRLQMNGFVIDVGSYAAALTDRSLEVADRIGLVKVDMGGTACKVPGARVSIEKIRAAGKLGKKRKTVKC